MQPQAMLHKSNCRVTQQKQIKLPYASSSSPINNVCQERTGPQRHERDSLDEEATRKAFAEKFIQHNPMSADGIDHLVAMTKFGFVWEHARWIVDKDIVVYHGMYSSGNPLAPNSPLLCVDMWRLEGDTIVEHWDALEVYPMNKLANLIAGGGDGIEGAGDPAKNKVVVEEFMKARTEGSDLSQFVSGDFIHHCASGHQGLEAFVKEDVVVKAVLASGDLAMVHAHYKTSQKAAFDWFRLVEGKIVEHWTVQQDIAKETENPHPHFSLEEC